MDIRRYLFIAAILPVGKLGGTGNFDKVLHFAGFYFLMIFFLQGYRERSWLMMLLISLGIGFLVEVVQ
jgi:4-amino-4-deoxy-L-arabinose transferase-like glycosyltransferase